MSRFTRLLFMFVGVVAALGGLARAVPFDVTNPGDPVTPTSANSPAAEQAPNAIDNRYNTKYLNFDTLNTGFTVVPSDPVSIVRGISITSANDHAERDPASFELLGSTDGVSFGLIASGDIPAFPTRHTQQQFAFPNSTAYSHYRVLFPTVQDAGSANSMQVEEVQLLTHLDVTSPRDVVVPTSANSPGGEQAPNVLDDRYNTKYLNFDKVGTGFTVYPRSGHTVVQGLSLASANDAPERDPASYELYGTNDNVTFDLIASGAVPAFAGRFTQQETAFANSMPYAAYRLVFPTLADEAAANSMQLAEVQLFGTVTQPAVPLDATVPGDAVTPTSANSPGAEQAPNAIDNRYDTKYLNFDTLGTGFTVTPSAGPTVIRGLSVTSANDHPERDPASFEILGSDDGATFTPIASGSIAPFPTRHTQQQIAFDNDTAYAHYRVLFPTVQDAGTANSMQVEEVQLLTELDVTGPGDLIVPTSLNSPGAERARGAIDDRYNTKYLNFDTLGTGFTVRPNSGLSVVRGISVASANDHAERDPVNYELYGSEDGKNFTLISAGLIPAFVDRFTQREVSFANVGGYAAYRVVFPDVADAATANSMQVGEVQLLGEVVWPHRTVNLDFSPAYNADLIVNNGTGVLDPAQDGIDFGGRNLLTQSAAAEIGGADGNGLPDNGLITGSPLGFEVQLGYHNADDGNNAIRLTAGESASIALDPTQQGCYATLFLFAANGSGDGVLTVDLHYADGSSESQDVTVDDWFNDGGELADGVFALVDAMDRTTGPGNGFENNNDPAIFAIPVTTDLTKALVGLDLTRTGGSGVTGLFGAAGRVVVPEPATLVVLGAGLLALARRRRR